MAGGETVVEMAPMFRRGVARIDVERLDGVDRLQHALDLRPAIDAQQDLAAGTHEGQRLIASRRRRRRARCPCARRRCRSRSTPSARTRRCCRLEAGDAAAAVEDLLFGTCWPKRSQCSILFSIQVSSTWVRRRTSADATACTTRGGRRVVVHDASPESAGNSRAKRSRSMSATVIPRRKAATLMRPRSAGVTSIVSRAVKAAASSARRLGASGVLIQLSASPGRAAKPRSGGARAHGAILAISAASAAISRAAGLFASSSKTSRPVCAASAKTTRWPMVP